MGRQSCRGLPQAAPLVCRLQSPLQHECPAWRQAWPADLLRGGESLL